MNDEHQPPKPSLPKWLLGRHDDPIVITSHGGEPIELQRIRESAINPGEEVFDGFELRHGGITFTRTLQHKDENGNWVACPSTDTKG